MTEADDLDIEKAFSDMASGRVTNRVGDLMKDEHRIGFEVVKKNDDNTRMLGIFAFKIEKDLVFAPVFFLSGEIKGPLLYRCDNKRFVPANKDWASYLIEHMQDTDGKPIDKSKSRTTESRVAMDRLLFHPTKEASIKDAVIEEFGEDIYGGIAKSLLKQADCHILKEFLEEPDYGKMAAEAIEKTASMEGSDQFVLRLAERYGTPDNFMPKAFTYTEQEPQEKEAHVLRIVEEFDKAAAENANQYWKDGFYLYDNRYLKDTCKVYVKDETDADLKPVTEQGTYNVLKEDGTLERDCFCVLVAEPDITYMCKCIGCDSDNSKSPFPSKTLVISDGKITYADKVLASKKSGDNVTEPVKPGVGPDGVTEGNLYVAYIPGQDTVCGFYHFAKVKTTDGVKYCRCKKLTLDDMMAYSYTVSTERERDWESKHYNDVTLNPDVGSSCVDKNIFGQDARFIKIKTKNPYPDEKKIDDRKSYKAETLEGIAEGASHDKWLYDSFDLPTLSVTFNKLASYPYEIHDTLANVRSQGLTRKEMLVKLAGDLSIKASDAYDIVDKAEQSGKVDFLYEGMDKLAMRIRIVGRPDWKDSEQSATGLPQSKDQRFVLNISGDQLTHQVPHIGDALNPTTATGLPNLTVATTDPHKLRDLADTYQLPHVFEHGLVASLADTFDANRLMDKYIPKLHEALDAIGRTLFLFYWKPDDFQRQYGQDDMNNLEAQLESEFESFGALTLNLAKKNDKQKAIDPVPGDIGD